MPKPIQYHAGISTLQYFSFIGLLTFIVCVCWLISDPVNRYQIETKLGLKPAIQISEDSFYHQRVEPVFEQYCAACHDARKAKGNLRIDSYLHTRYSGKNGNNIVPFEADNSQIINRMQLAENDKRLMPPLGWDKPTEDEMTVLKMWINQGALANQSVAEFADAPEKVVEVTIPQFDMQMVKQARAPLETKLNELKAEFGYAVNYVSRDSHLLRFSNVSLSQPITDKRFEQFSQIAANLASLYIRDGQLTDASKPVFLQMTELTDAYLQGVAISEQTLFELINKAQNLQRLTVHGNLITPKIKALCTSRDITINEVSHA